MASFRLNYAGLIPNNGRVIGFIAFNYFLNRNVSSGFFLSLYVSEGFVALSIASYVDWRAVGGGRISSSRSRWNDPSFD